MKRTLLVIFALFQIGVAFSQSDSTIIFIERHGVFKTPLVLPKTFKVYAKLLNDTVGLYVKNYKEIKVSWIKSHKTDFTSEGFRLDTTKSSGMFLVAANYEIGKSFFLYEDRRYLFNSNNYELYPGKVFTLESYIHKWNGADIKQLVAAGCIVDSMINIDIKANGKIITNVQKCIPKVMFEGNFNEDGISDFVLLNNGVFEMYISKNQTYKQRKCKVFFGDINVEF